jgi:predicted metal-dependent enzyme (double-stranded beta helix superfamily)
MSGFDLGRFVDDCVAAVADDRSHRGIHSVMTRAFADPVGVLGAVGAPVVAGLFVPHRADNLTILNIVWAPGMRIPPHNHTTWAMIGIYQGREDNIFWRRRRDDRARIEAKGAAALATGDVMPMGRDIIHSVLNPLDRLTGAIHVYGADFYSLDRSEWDVETLTERPFDTVANRARFGIAD